MARLWDGHTLKRSYKDGIARFNAYLEDYALFAGSLIDLYEASLEGRYLELARTMADAIDFSSPRRAVFLVATSMTQSCEYGRPGRSRMTTV